MKTLRPIQRQKADEAFATFSLYNVVYIAAEVRTGKNCTSMEVCKMSGAKKVIFLTKKNAIGKWISMDHENNYGVIGDYHDFKYDDHFELIVINDESMHKLAPKDVAECDIVIHDEHHRFGGFPKPGKYTKMFKQMFGSKPQIYLSGTSNPESFSQLYHQMWVSSRGPWTQYSSFYKWAKDYVDVRQKRLGTHIVNDYTRGDEGLILQDMNSYMVIFTQADSGFKSKVEEEVMEVEMSNTTKMLTKRLIDDRVIEGKEELILADTPAKLQQKLHQLWSGTIKFDSGNKTVLDYSKVEFIQSKFLGMKIAIFYKFTQEYVALKDKLGDKLTNSISEFNEDPMKWIALQVQSGAEGTNLSKADYLVNYNIDFSAKNYWQSRDRMTVMDREVNNVVWIFAKGGIEHKVYKAVKAKKKYTTAIFKKEYKIK